MSPNGDMCGRSTSPTGRGIMNTDTDTDSDSDSKHRIVLAADMLYEQSDRARFPTMDAVRRQARAA